MYHEDKGIIVDVELLAECGQIAQHLRKFERIWMIELKQLQKQSVRAFGRPPIPSTASLKQKLDAVFVTVGTSKITSDEKEEDDEFDEEYAKHLRYLEDIVINIYQLNQPKENKKNFGCCDNTEESQRQKNSTNKIKENNINSNDSIKVHIKSNMNYSVAGAEKAEESATKNNNNELTALPTDTRDDQQQHFDAHLCTRKQQQQQHQTTPTTTTTTSIESSGSDNNNKSLMNNDSDKKEQNLNLTTIEDVSSINKQQQQQLLAKITDDDLKMLLKEMKKKVEFTEKMNWLCK
jgi:hypothetical protein